MINHTLFFFSLSLVTEGSSKTMNVVIDNTLIPYIYTIYYLLYMKIIIKLITQPKIVISMNSSMNN